MKRHRGCETLGAGHYVLDVPPGQEVIIKGREFAAYLISDEPIAKRPRVESESWDLTRTVLGPDQKPGLSIVVEPERKPRSPVEQFGRTIWTRWKPDCTTRNAHERDVRIRFDDTPDPENNNERRHDYYIDNKKNSGTSVTSVLKHYWQPFDADAQAEKCSRGKNPLYAGKTPDEIKGMWRATSELGTARHAAMEMFLERNEAEIQWEFVPIGFLRFLNDHPTFVPYRVEWSLFHYNRAGYPLYGQVDAVFLDTATGKLVVVDWKNTKGFLDDAFFGKTGTHPRTWRIEATKPNQYAFQVQAYMTMLMREYRLPYQISHGLLLNFDPADPEGYNMVRVECRDLGAPGEMFDDFPWKDDAPSHRRFDLQVPPDFPAIPFDDARADGPTISACISKLPSIWAWKKEDGIVWVGHKYDKWKLPQSRWAPPKRFYGSIVPWAAAAHYEEYLLALEQRPLLHDLVTELYGKQLACWCTEGSCHCHASVLARYANVLGSTFFPAAATAPKRKAEGEPEDQPTKKKAKKNTGDMPPTEKKVVVKDEW